MSVRSFNSSSVAPDRRSRNRKKEKFKICVGDKVLVNWYDKELEGHVMYHGPVDHADKGFKEFYGVEVTEGEGSSNGEFKGCEIKNKSQARKYFFVNTNQSAVFIKKRQILSVLKPINGKRLTMHDRVYVNGRSNGTIKFIGPTLFGPHIWYGIELDDKKGRNNGMVRNIRYFECGVQRGVFVREEKLLPLDKYGNPINKLNTYKHKTRQQMMDELFDACTKGDIKTVRTILMVDKTVARDAKDQNTEVTALMTASYHGYDNIVSELVNTHKVELNATTTRQMTALHMASQQGHEKVVAILLTQQETKINLRTDDGTTALYLAVEKGHINVVDRLLKQFADANISTREEESPLIQACHRGFDDIVLQLIHAPNVHLNQKRKSDGATALFVACREGSVKCVKHLLSNQMININESKTNGRSPLFIAAFFGHSEIVDLLLTHSKKMRSKQFDHGVIDVNNEDSKGFTPLFVAAQNGHDEIVKLLLKNGADVNKAEQRGHTPLWIAALRGHVDVVRTLLCDKNIDIDFKDLSGVTALWAACQNNNADVVELLLHPRNVIAQTEEIVDHSGRVHKRVKSIAASKFSMMDMDMTNLHNANESDEDDDIVSSNKNQGSDSDENEEDDDIGATIEDDIDNQNNINNRKRRRKYNDKSHKKNARINSDNNTPHSNSKNNRGHTRRGANPNLAKHDGCTPLWIASSRGNWECMDHLIKYGANLNKPDRSQGATPLFVACQNGKKPAVDMLLAAHANVNRPRTGDGTSPLMMAAHNGHSGIVDVLLKSGADPMQCNGTGLNALGCASMQGHEHIVKLIFVHLQNVKHPSEIREFVNAGDGVNGWTPLHLACMGGHYGVIKHLIEVCKVDLMKKDYENKTGSEHAWQNGHHNIAAWLSPLEQSSYSRL